MGAIELSKEECRDARGLALMDSLKRDVAYACRALRRSPAYSAVAIASLAIGIGANTTIFTFVNAGLFRPLPYPRADRLVVLHEQFVDSPKPLNVHPANFVAWRDRARSFTALVLVQAVPMNVFGRDGAEQVVRLLTTADLFDVFQVRPLWGRGFTDADTRPGAPRVAMIGERFWRRWFGGDATVVGRPWPTPDGSVTIVGIAPAGLRVGAIEPEVFTPLTVDPANPNATGSRAFDAYARLAAAATLESSRAEMNAIAATLRTEHRFDEGFGVAVSDLHDYLTRDIRPGLRLLMLAAATMLVLACANLAALLMARGLTRRAELAVRTALGASTGRLVRQLLVESGVLALCGGAAGWMLSSWATRSLALLGGDALVGGSADAVHLDLTAFTFTLALSVITAMAFGVLPARLAARVDPQDALRERTRGTTTDRRHQRLTGGLVVSQIALAVALLVGAGLLLRTLSSLVRVPLGFEPSGTVTMGLFLGVRPPSTRAQVVDRIIDRVQQVPGVKAAGTIQFLPLSGATCGTAFWLEADAGIRDPARSLPIECALVSRGYVAAMGIRVVDGRAFDRQDTMTSPRVLMVNEAFARRYVPGGHAPGRRILVQGSNQALAEIVGVVGDVRHDGLTSDVAPTVYLLHAQTPGYITNLVVRTAGEPMAQALAVRHAIHDVDPTEAASNARAIQTDVAKVLAKPRLYALLVTLFAAIAVLLATVGLYGLLSYVVTQHAREIGIRLALGATRQQVFVEQLRGGARLIAAGLVIGTAAALGARQLLASHLFGVTTADPATYLLAILTLSAAAVIAIVVPAARASAIEPLRALRNE